MPAEIIISSENCFKVKKNSRMVKELYLELYSELELWVSYPDSHVSSLASSPTRQHT